MAKKTIFRENYLTHKPNGFTPDEYEKNGVNLDSYSFRKEKNKKKNKEEQKESRNMAKNIIRLTESDLHRIVKESVERILRESADEFEYSDSEDLGRGRHRQIIIYNGKEIGYLLYIEKNWLAPVEERYILPDIEYGMSEPTDGMLDGKKGWIDFKTFNDYESAFAYAKQNFEQLAYLFEYGDYD